MGEILTIPSRHGMVKIHPAIQFSGAAYPALRAAGGAGVYCRWSWEEGMVKMLDHQHLAMQPCNILHPSSLCVNISETAPRCLIHLHPFTPSPTPPANQPPNCPGWGGG